MVPFLITTNGLCIHGKAVVWSDSKDNAKKVFIESLGDESDAYENEIISIKEVDTNKAQVIYYDDGDR
jgi:hypothetical protein